jgi:hypothetical protein
MRRSVVGRHWWFARQCLARQQSRLVDKGGSAASVAWNNCVVHMD